MEALELMRQFQNFQANGQQNAELFANPKRLAEAADVIRKLKLIAQELSDDKFKPTKDRIELRYEDIRKNLVNRFQKATKGHDKDEMKKYADILSNFKGYQACVNEFVETNSSALLRKTIVSLKCCANFFDPKIYFSINHVSFFKHPNFMQKLYKC